MRGGETVSLGATIRGDSLKKKIALVFTGDEFADGADLIKKALLAENIKASFFLTGNFYRNTHFKNLIITLKKDGHYLGPHSDQHLLYCDWNNRDSLLVTPQEFEKDLNTNYKVMASFGINRTSARFFLPPYEWYNKTIASWTAKANLKLVNFTPGTRSNADYTYPEMGKSYRSSDEIFQSIVKYNESKPNGLNGFILLLHIGTDPRRTDKFYRRLPELINYLKENDYELVRIDHLLKD
ncbi:polysaccharide deacetylase family protein [Pedobacter nototheniae]|uniref:polysaccharide deacetylase family protein n=1 Tax=Pedobacter nototheniae TaxID=2488994 RepID=UPI0029318E9E|nr:polysaccharide deacetylase family protein [Pedobacter nototheniae]